MKKIIIILIMFFSGLANAETYKVKIGKNQKEYLSVIEPTIKTGEWNCEYLHDTWNSRYKKVIVRYDLDEITKISFDYRYTAGGGWLETSLDLSEGLKTTIEKYNRIWKLGEFKESLTNSNGYFEFFEICNAIILN
jgi:hypothetical protein